MKFSTTLVKQSLTGHSWIGLLVGVLMYIVCLTGTLSVFYPELQRWEQADIAESPIYDLATLEKTYNALIANSNVVTDHMYLYLPTADTPRAAIATENEAWFLNIDGSLGERVDHSWTEFLVNLHVYLTIPSSLGIILVSALGAMLCALIISGFLSHPKILKDAFKLRLDGNSRLEQVDMHNRLSVWGAPFHLLIAVTGAYFGLVLPMLGAVSALTGADAAEIQAAVFGVEPELHQEGSFQVVQAVETLAVVAPEAEPQRFIVHNAGKPAQFLEILAEHPGRLILSENYQFDTEGNYLGKTGFSDGEIGQQVVYSMYDLHFGHFAGYMSKIIYFLLGLALTIVSVTGINIWLKKRSFENQLNELWVGCIWGLPIALLLTVLAQLTAGLASATLFWLSFAGVLIYSLTLGDERICKRHLLFGTAAITTLVLAVHVGKFGNSAFTGAGLMVNCALLGLLVTCLLLARKPLTLASHGDALNLGSGNAA